jgi:hypothetical protein
MGDIAENMLVIFRRDSKIKKLIGAGTPCLAVVA